MPETLNRPGNDRTIRDTLFGDQPLEQWAGAESEDLPWNLFKDAKRCVDKGKNNQAIEMLKKITTLPGLESRHYLQAYFFLNELGSFPEADIELFAVVVEVAMDEGLDLLAIYADHSARYYHASGAGVIWDVPDITIGSKIDHILSLGNGIIEQIGPWKAERPAAPVNGRARLNLLTSKGLHFGEADQNVLFQDPLSSKIMYAMLDMMETLVNKAKK
ncbi:MAG: hypothetical protein ABI741_16275 [Ferruginibacter sp.]